MRCCGVVFMLSVLCVSVRCGIRNGAVLNKLIKVKPVGGISKFMPLTEIPPPVLPVHSGRRHMEDCRALPSDTIVGEEKKVVITGDYYDDNIEKKLVTILFPSHIDRRHFEITTQVPYLTVGEILGIGYHPSTKKSEYPAECERIYQDHIAAQYSDEWTEQSEESLEMARVPPDEVEVTEPEAVVEIATVCIPLSEGAQINEN